LLRRKSRYFYGKRRCKTNEDDDDDDVMKMKNCFKEIEAGVKKFLRERWRARPEAEMSNPNFVMFCLP
jgi:hypothetical protein